MKWKYVLLILIILASINTVEGAYIYMTDYGVYSSSIWTNNVYIWSNTLVTNMDVYANYETYSYSGGSTSNWAQIQIRYTNENPTSNTRIYGSKVYWNYPTISYPSLSSSYAGLRNTGRVSFLSTVDGSGKIGMNHQRSTVVCSPPSSNTYTVSGVTGCISDVTIYGKYQGGDYGVTGETVLSTVDTYSYKIIDQFSYKLVFSDGHEYEFTCTGDVTYDRDGCTFININFKDNCDNDITNIKYATARAGYYDYPLSWNTGSSASIQYDGYEYLEVYTETFDGVLGYKIENIDTDLTYSLVNPNTAWINTIWVYDAIESHLLNDALVTLSQDCIIDASLYPVRNRYTDAGGYACFSQCELDSFSLDVSLTGYQTYSSGINIGVGDMDAFNQSQLIMIELYPYDDESNTSHYNFTDFTTAIYFKDNDSKITSEIHNTDEYVDLYYHNNNTLDSSMVLKFEMGLAGTFNSYDTVLSWLIPSEEAGYKRILNDNFSNHLNYYRATLTNAEIDGWDKLKYLSVINETNEVIYHYENLSSNVWFTGAVNNKIEYKEDISVTAYANSNNSTLLNVSLELYNETNMIEYINLTWADFSDPSDRWYYRWMPTAEYEKNKNYTVKMFGFNYQFLKDDMVYTTDLHKNKLTIRVVDESGDYLTDAYVVLDGYGSLSTGSTFYNSYQGLDDGKYLYKATKLDYTGAGWESVNLSGTYEIVNYTLTSSGSAEGAGITPIHFSDSDLQSFFYPLMFFLLMCILLGGLKYVAK